VQEAVWVEVGPKWKLLQKFAAFARAAFDSTAEEEGIPQITDPSGSFDGVLLCLAMAQAQAPSGKERAEVPLVAPESFGIVWLLNGWFSKSQLSSSCIPM
jgi:hypothetical protein